MSQNLIALFLAASLGQFPGAGPGSSPYGGGAVMTAPNSTQAFGTGDPTYPYDYEPNWMHGYYQDIPAYHGHHFFRPYNYKHVLPQTQAAAAWGIPPQLPISHPNFNSINGMPALPPPYQPPYQNIPHPNHTGTRTTSRQNATEDINSQFSRIDKRKGVTSAYRPRATERIARNAANQTILEAQYQTRTRSIRVEE